MSFATESGISNIGKIPWGSHFCHLYENAADLAEVLIPYFATGLQNNQRCIWITSEPYSSENARKDLAHVVPDLGRKIFSEQLSICEFDDWYVTAGSHQDTTIDRWLKEEHRALERGYEGLRIAESTSFVEPRAWEAFMDYERSAQAAFKGRRLLALCSYDVTRLGTPRQIDVFQHHHFRVCRNDHFWELYLASLPLLMGDELSNPLRTRICQHTHEQVQNFRCH